jgi:arylsulfatase A-like enzyme
MSHAGGHESAEVLTALRIVDDTLARIREKLERRNEWANTRLWVTSDHGHSGVRSHEDLARVVAGFGYRVKAHPWVYGLRDDVAVMVCGNSMAHVYVDLARRQRPFLSGMSASGRALIPRLLERASVDLLFVPETETSCAVLSATRGRAVVSHRARAYSYTRQDGDPLCIGGDCHDLSPTAAYDACAETPYPDALVQLAELAAAPRSGDVMVSAAAGWDLRLRYEPMEHLSTHGSLRREHMMVPLLSSHAPKGTPRRTTDLMPSTLAAIGLPIPRGMDGESFL